MSQSDIPTDTEQIILIIIKDRNGKLHFSVSPTLNQIVTIHDMLYIKSLLRDFIQRAAIRPLDLFQQLCSLDVGPLVTKEVGSNLVDQPHLWELLSRFLPYLG